ncbi:MAG: hypothetical protein JNG88_17135, partial [Phycisphaerales bacterium]|nr:hypothetical protein [Phycisphaerales bacterium]
QLRPVVDWDGTTFVVAWDDQRNQTYFFDERTDIYGARVTESGVVVDPTGFPICAATTADTTAAILSRADGVSLVASSRFTMTPEFDSYRVGITRIGDFVLTGDLDCDGSINNFDIDPFVLALTSPDAYAAAFPNCDLLAADTNADGVVNNFDIDAFVTLLAGG